MSDRGLCISRGLLARARRSFGDKSTQKTPCRDEYFVSSGLTTLSHSRH